MSRTRQIVVPLGFRCSECGSDNLIGAGTGWRRNPDGNNPKRIRYQQFRCKDCGKISADGKVQED